MELRFLAITTTHSYGMDRYMKNKCAWFGHRGQLQQQENPFSLQTHNRKSIRISCEHTALKPRHDPAAKGH